MINEFTAGDLPVQCPAVLLNFQEQQCNCGALLVRCSTLIPNHPHPAAPPHAAEHAAAAEHWQGTKRYPYAPYQDRTLGDGILLTLNMPNHYWCVAYMLFAACLTVSQRTDPALKGPMPWPEVTCPNAAVMANLHHVPGLISSYLETCY